MRKPFWRYWVKNISWFFVLMIKQPTLYAIVLNDPYPASQAQENIYYASFSEQPKTLDPARSYTSNEYQFIAQIYEPLLQYDYLARPYQLVCLLCDKMPQITYFNAQQQPANPKEPIQYTQYLISLKKGVYYQPHPALAKDSEGNYRYLHLPLGYLDQQNIEDLPDFPKMGTREVIADDFIYQIKRLANPAVSSPIYGFMSNYIVDFANFYQKLPPKAQQKSYVDLRRYDLHGVQKIDDYHFTILIQGQYPQFIYWLAMLFFTPMPWEADQFYAQADMKEKDISLDWYPIGTGPFMLADNNPNSQMVMQKNPNHREMFCPTNPNLNPLPPSTPLPRIDQAIYVLEKESIPRWNKFLQGYYDLSGISNDSFDQAIHIGPQGEALLTPAMQAKQIRLRRYIDPSIYYLGFNMLDPVLGGNSEAARHLRQAISIAINYEEQIAIFFNGRGLAAQGPIPPGIFGYQVGNKGMNPYTYHWQDNKAERLSLAEAKRHMQLAGYPGGRDPATGQPLLLHYDTMTSGGPDDKAAFDWMRKQFAKIGIELDIRATQYNRFQEKMRTGNAQIFSWAWSADYPDPENFLFLLYGPNGKVKYGGENAANYANKDYDRLFEMMKNLPNGPTRQKIIDQLVEIARHDAPWAFGMHTETLILAQQWVHPAKPNPFNLNTLKYLSLDVAKRYDVRILWNQAIVWPIFLILGLLALAFLPVFYLYFKKEHQTAQRWIK